MAASYNQITPPYAGWTGDTFTRSARSGNRNQKDVYGRYPMSDRFILTEVHSVSRKRAGFTDAVYRFSGGYSTEAFINAIPSVTSRVSNSSLGRYYDSLSSSVDTAVDILEARQTVSLLTETFKSFGSAYRNLRKGNVRALFKDLGITDTRLSKRMVSDFKTARKGKYHKDDKFLSDKFLEVQFGWLPLLESSYNHATLLERILNGTQPLRVYASGISKETFSWTQSWVTKYSGQTFDRSVKGSLDMSVVWSGIYEIKSKDLWKRNLHDFGFTNPLKTAWNLIPYSFVLDMTILPVSRFLGQFDATVGLTTVGLCRSHRVSTRAIHDTRASLYLDRSRYLIASTAMKAEQFTRLKYSTLPVYRLIPPVNISDTLNFNKVLTLAALFDQRKGK